MLYMNSYEVKSEICILISNVFMKKCFCSERDKVVVEIPVVSGKGCNPVKQLSQ